MTTTSFHLSKTPSIDALNQLSQKKHQENQKAKSQNDFKWNCVKLLSTSCLAGVATAFFIDIVRKNSQTSFRESLLIPFKLSPLNVTLGTIAFASVFIPGSVYFFSKGPMTDTTFTDPVTTVTVKNPIFGLKKRIIIPRKKTPPTQALNKVSRAIRRRKPLLPASRLRTSNVIPSTKRKKHSNLVHQILLLEKNDVEKGNDYQWNQNLNKFEASSTPFSFDQLFQQIDRKAYPFKFKDCDGTLKIIDNPVITHSKNYFKIRFKRSTSSARFILLENHLLIWDDDKSKKNLYLIDLSKFGMDGEEKMRKGHFSLCPEGKQLLIQLKDIAT